MYGVLPAHTYVPQYVRWLQHLEEGVWSLELADIIPQAEQHIPLLCRSSEHSEPRLWVLKRDVFYQHNYLATSEFGASSLSLDEFNILSQIIFFQGKHF